MRVWILTRPIVQCFLDSVKRPSAVETAWCGPIAGGGEGFLGGVAGTQPLLKPQTTSCFVLLASSGIALGQPRCHWPDPEEVPWKMRSYWLRSWIA